MKNKKILVSLLALSCSAFAIGPVHADPSSITVYISCPSTQLGQYQITNFGNYIAGFGGEYILGQTLNVYFKSQNLPYNTPASLNNYFNETVSYDSTTGMVTCSYQSNVGTDPFITASYMMTNGKGGSIQSQTPESITVMFPVGLKA